MKTVSNPKPKSGKALSVDWAESASFPVPIPKDEPKRIATLKKYHILDTPPEDNFDHLTRLAAHICGTPIALVTLVDSDRQWFKSKVGLTFSETSRDVAFCAHAIMHRELFVVADATKDKRFAGNPLVKSDPKIRFYAGMPLVTPNNQALGTLCVLDYVPRVLTKDQTKALKSLSNHVMQQMETRRKLHDLKESSLDNKRQVGRLEKERIELETRLKQKDDFLQRLGHEIRTSTNVLINLAEQMNQAGALTPEQREYIQLTKSTCESLQLLTKEITASRT